MYTVPNQSKSLQPPPRAAQRRQANPTTEVGVERTTNSTQQVCQAATSYEPMTTLANHNTSQIQLPCPLSPAKGTVGVVGHQV
mmetsp:Transcript_90095/g.197339  ORF Transcript_90095/g.197339 Transcript_90095/m.197339 type:complete len:83 (+) Transcript_90095:434-682(+)